MTSTGVGSIALLGSVFILLFYVPKNIDMTIKNRIIAITALNTVVQLPSYHRSFNRAPHWGQESADLLTLCPQSPHSIKLLKCFMLGMVPFLG